MYSYSIDPASIKLFIEIDEKAFHNSFMVEIEDPMHTSESAPLSFWKRLVFWKKEPHNIPLENEHIIQTGDLVETPISTNTTPENIPPLFDSSPVQSENSTQEDVLFDIPVPRTTIEDPSPVDEHIDEEKPQPTFFENGQPSTQEIPEETLLAQDSKISNPIDLLSEPIENVSGTPWLLVLGLFITAFVSALVLYEIVVWRNLLSGDQPPVNTVLLKTTPIKPVVLPPSAPIHLSKTTVSTPKISSSLPTPPALSAKAPQLLTPVPLPTKPIESVKVKEIVQTPIAPVKEKVADIPLLDSAGQPLALSGVAARLITNQNDWQELWRTKSTYIPPVQFSKNFVIYTELDNPAYQNFTISFYEQQVLNGELMIGYRFTPRTDIDSGIPIMYTLIPAKNFPIQLRLIP